jgi:acyl-coenzyme A thioesterase PaaI-like protein
VSDGGGRPPPGRLDDRLRRAGSPSSDRRRLEGRRLGDALRLVIDRLATTGATAEQLADAADQAGAIAAALEPLSPGDGNDRAAEPETARLADAFFDRSPLLGTENPLAPPIRVDVVDGRIVGRVAFGSAYQGPPGLVHGGCIAAGFDEILGLVNSISEAPAMTGTLTVRYRQPTPLHIELTYVGVLVDVRGRRVRTRGELWAGEVMTAEAEGLFVRIGPARLAELTEAGRRRATEIRPSAGTDGR